MHRVGAYRVQLRPSFTFDDVERLVPYFASLGLSHLYTSPYLQSAEGSAHGYDVVDPGKVNEALGGEPGRARLVEALARHGLGQLIDIVPNHMAIRGGHNSWWWDVLENGPSSRYSGFFDVEWQASVSERVLLPILGDQYGVELEAGKITVQRKQGRFLVCYYEHQNPVAPRVLGDLLRPVAERLGSSELGFTADALAELPSPNAPDAASRRRRHRDKEILLEQLGRCCDLPDVAEAIDQELARINADPDALDAVLDRQIYRLAYWKVGNHELDYRRFFDIDSLVGLRVEDDEVLEATHHLVFRWLQDGSVAGLRVDHIDGLYDPAQYLDRLRARAPNAWLLVEKILERGETLPDWPIAGTTGYEFLNLAGRLLVDPGGRAELDRLYADILGEEEEDFEALLRRCKREVLRESLATDVQRLVVRLSALCQNHRRYRDYPRVDLETAMAELCVAFPVYRTYLRVGQDGAPEVSATDRSVIEGAIRRAQQEAPQLDPRLFSFIEQLLLLNYPGDDEREFARRVQQLTGPAMAKGAEDTAFYRHARLVALNEVGGDPSEFSVDSQDFHEQMRRRQEQYPDALSTTSTHDTKRSEDVRARLFVLSEDPVGWRAAVEQWRRRLAGAKTPGVVAGEPAPDPRTEYFLLQNLVGAWPIDQQRMLEFAIKAVREAKLHSSWHSSNDSYERAVQAYMEALYADREVVRGIESFVASLAEATMANSICQLVLKTLCPGVPDIYQGTELWDFSLVDPDNRRSVDYTLRQRLMGEIESSPPQRLWDERESGAVKLYFLRQALQLRARRPECFDRRGDYAALPAQGSQSRRIVAWCRGAGAVGLVTRWWKKHAGDFGDTRLDLPPGTWKNVVTGVGGFEGSQPILDLLGAFPAAMLERQEMTHG